MPTTCLIRDRSRRAYCWCRIAFCVLSVAMGLSLTLSAQRIDAPPRLEPTANALTGLQECGKSIAKSAPKVSSKLLDAQKLLTRGLLIGWNNPSGEFAAVAPPKEYVEELAKEADWCLKVANILNTEPARKTQAENVLISITNDLVMKVEDCREWGMGRMVPVTANTIKNGKPDAGWTVMYKWMSIGGLGSVEQAFPQVSTPTAKALPPGMYSLYATRQSGATVQKTQPVNCAAFQKEKVQCEIPVP
jgi:hypothetical protein